MYNHGHDQLHNVALVSDKRYRPGPGQWPLPTGHRHLRTNVSIAPTVCLVYSSGVEKEVKISYNIKVCPKNYIPAGKLIFYLL